MNSFISDIFDRLCSEASMCFFDSVILVVVVILIVVCFGCCNCFCFFLFGCDEYESHHESSSIVFIIGRMLKRHIKQVHEDRASSIPLYRQVGQDQQDQDVDIAGDSDSGAADAARRVGQARHERGDQGCR